MHKNANNFHLPCLIQHELTLYNPEDSKPGQMVTCSQEFCADGSYSIGHFIVDVVQYDSVSGDLDTYGILRLLWDT